MMRVKKSKSGKSTCEQWYVHGWVDEMDIRNKNERIWSERTLEYHNYNVSWQMTSIRGICNKGKVRWNCETKGKKEEKTKADNDMQKWTVNAKSKPTSFRKWEERKRGRGRARETVLNIPINKQIIPRPKVRGKKWTNSLNILVNKIFVDKTTPP